MSMMPACVSIGDAQHTPSHHNLPLLLDVLGYYKLQKIALHPQMEKMSGAMYL
jgi:hypothetical protein